MTKKIHDISQHRNKKKPRSLAETSKAVSRRFPELVPSDIDEPEGLISGDPFAKSVKISK